MRKQVILNPFQTNGVFYTITSGWSIVYIKELQVIISKKKYVSFSKDRYNAFIANSAEPNEMPYYVAFYLRLHCLQKYLFSQVSGPQRG